VAFSTSSLTIPAGGSAAVDVTITAPGTLADRGLFGGYIVITPAGGGASYQVPYTGFKGDYQSIPVLTPASPFGNPLLRKTLTFGPSESVTIRPALDEVAFVLLHLDHSVRRLRLEVFDAVTGQAWHRALEAEYIGRNSGPASFFVLPWDGITVQGSGNGAKIVEVPSGQYELRLSVLKALGDPENPAHWEEWTSPTFVTVVR
jgi:hypothetical protein